MCLSCAVLIVSPALSGLNGAESSASPIEQTRSTLDKWVETRQLIAKSRADWQVERESLVQSVAILEQAAKDLDEQIKTARETASKADEERQKLLEQGQVLTKGTEAIASVISGLEAQTLTLIKWLPDPLRDTIRELSTRIPKDAASAKKSSVSQRMLNVVGILSEIDKFNNDIRVTTELRKIPQGGEIQVRTMYLGLAIAYFVDNTGNYAGVGQPTAEGWQWTARNDLGPRIADVVNVYENAATAHFVPLPVTIN